MKTPSPARAYQALIRNDFSAFTHKVFTTLNPGQIYIPNWHIDAINWQLDRVRRGEIRRLIINMPPRSLKSITASVAFPAFLLGLDPTRRIICVSYSGELAKKHSNDTRTIIESPWYRALFPTTQIGPFKNTETEIEFTARGFRLATSVGGTLTGRGSNLIILDDVLKPSDAYSETSRSFVNEWFSSTLYSRLDDKQTGAIIVVMQRVHLNDLTGFVLERSDEWEVLSLPAIAEHDQLIPLSSTKTYLRKAGEVLSPEREPLKVLESTMLQIGGDAFSAQYQQSPVPPGGAMVKRRWLKRYQVLPNLAEQWFTLQSWDTASKGGPNNDWSVCTTWVVTRSNQWYLVHVFRKRVDYPELKSSVLNLAREWKAQRILVEDTATGTALVQELRSLVSGIIAIRPEGDKVGRMAVASAKFEAGQVFFPEWASWLPDIEAELFSFPGSRHDDQCDSISQAFLHNNAPLIITPAMLASVRARRYRNFGRGYLDD